MRKQQWPRHNGKSLYMGAFTMWNVVHLTTLMCVRGQEGGNI